MSLKQFCSIRNNGFWHGLICLLILLGFSEKSFAQRWVVYSTAQGLAGEQVNDILVAQDGQIWFATENGVSLFNGAWINFRKENGFLLDNFISSIVQDRDGLIWFGTKGGITRIDPGSELSNIFNWQSYTVLNTGGGLSSNNITSILIASQEKLWFGTKDGGISIVDPTPDFDDPSQDPLLNIENWLTFTTDDALSSNFIHTMELDGSGNIWVISNFPNTSLSRFIDIFKFNSRQWTTFSLSPFDFTPKNSIFKDNNDNMWIGTQLGLFKTNPNNLSTFDERYTTSDGLAQNSVLAIAQDKMSALWLGHASQGVSVTFPGSNLRDSTNWKNFTILDGLGDNFITSIGDDTEEGVWFGHLEERGLSQLDRTWLSFLTKKGSFSNFVEGLFNTGNRTLWIATKGGAVKVNLDAKLFLDKSFSNLFSEANSGLASDVVRMIFKDSRANLWFVTDVGANKVAENDILMQNQWQLFDEASGLKTNKVRWIEEDVFEFLWFATDSGVSRVHVDSTLLDDKWTTVRESEGLVSDQVFNILKDKNGRLWFGTDKGISFFDPKTDPEVFSNWINYDMTDGLINNVVRSIFEDTQGNIWFGTFKGVSKIDPSANLRDPINWQGFTTEDGLASNFVTSIDQSGENEIWFGTAIGASKFEQDNLINQWTTYTIASGLKSNFITSIFVDPVNENEGDIWFGTDGGGVTRYRPQKGLPETFLENKKDIVTENRITFNFRGADITTQEEDLQFLYTLDDQDPVATLDNSATVFVPDSDRPERHVFQVMAIDRDGNIDPSPATDVFYKIKSELGGNVVFSDDDEKTKAELFIPPGEVLKDTAIFIEPVKRLELPESNVIAAYRLSSEPDGMRFKNRATLKISFLDENINSTEDLNIFLRDNDAWKPIGGRVKRDSSTLSVTTSIQEFGVYAVRSERINTDASAQPLSVQPRVISPKTPNKGFGAEATISFHLKEPSTVDVKVYDVAGRLVKEVISGQMLPGINSVIWDGTDRDQQPVRSGLYVVLVKTNKKSETKTIVVSNSFK